MKVLLNDQKAVSMVELLIAIALGALLAVLLLPVFQSVRGAGQSARCLTQIRDVGTSLLAYASDHNNVLLPRKVVEDGKEIHWHTILIRQGYLPLQSETNRMMSCPSAPPPETRFNVYGMWRWGGSTNVEYDSFLPLARIPSPHYFFLLTESSVIEGTKTRQWYTVSTGMRNNQVVHLRHSKRANTFFADGHAEPKERKYFETLHLYFPDFTRSSGFGVIE